MTRRSWLLAGAVVAFAVVAEISDAHAVTYTPRTPPAAVAPAGTWRCATPITYIINGGPGTAPLRYAIARAIDRAAEASGQPYVWALYGAAPELTITVTDRESSQLLQIDGTADDGYTAPTLDRIDILSTIRPEFALPLVMHELMLSRDLREADDGYGGHLGHFTARTTAYSDTDLALMQNTACR